MDGLFRNVKKKDTGKVILDGNWDVLMSPSHLFPKCSQINMQTFKTTNVESAGIPRSLAPCQRALLPEFENK